MLLLKPGFKIITPIDVTNASLERIKAAGQVCYKSENNKQQKTPEEFAEMLIRLGHESVLEHESISVHITCDRGVTHEIVRHRLASYSQESTRYCDYAGGEVAFIIPPWCYNVDEGLYGPSWEDNTGAVEACEALWLNAMIMAEEYYKDLRHQDWSPQQARSVLPNSLKTEIVMTANLREWRHFFNLRCATAAHPQMREIAIPMLVEFHKRIPMAFSDLMGKFQLFC